jgi:hypothetical protein
MLYKEWPRFSVQQTIAAEWRGGNKQTEAEHRTCTCCARHSVLGDNRELKHQVQYTKKHERAVANHMVRAKLSAVLEYA